MLLASRVFSLIKILNSSIFYKILGFCAKLESLYGNCYRQLFSVTLFGFFGRQGEEDECLVLKHQ